MSNPDLPITLDMERCSGCGACVPVCHERAIALKDGKAAIDARVCSTCSQCIAVCPERALRWRGVAATARRPELLPSTDQLDELLQQRRSVRRYTGEKLPRQQLAAIAASAAYAPTNNYDLRLVIVDDPEILRRLELGDRPVSRGLRLERAMCRGRALHHGGWRLRCGAGL